MIPCRGGPGRFYFPFLPRHDFGCFSHLPSCLAGNIFDFGLLSPATSLPLAFSRRRPLRLWPSLAGGIFAFGLLLPATSSPSVLLLPAKSLPLALLLPAASSPLAFSRRRHVRDIRPSPCSRRCNLRVPRSRPRQCPQAR